MNIKVRAYDLHEKRYVPVEAITFHHLTGEPHTIKTASGEWAIAQRFVLEYWTGLRDKSGKEIYEGDLLRDHGYLGVVEFGSIERLGRQGLFYANLSKGGGTGDKVFLDPGSEVVGNIHDNPELVK